MTLISTFEMCFRCFAGGREGTQYPPFKIAAGLVRTHLKDENVVFQIIDVKFLRENTWSVRDFVNWLLSGHIHFIIAHIHQGLQAIGWEIEDLYAELLRLRDHPGFPRANKLECPIFTQDKFKYLDALPPGYTMPSCRVPLSRDMDMIATETLIQR
jgi:hypothetical protein